MKFNVNFDIELKENPFEGKFIAIEGIDGSGKTTQAHQLKKFLKKNGNHVFFTKNPTDSLIGKLIRKILMGKSVFNPVAFQYLYVADRAFQQGSLEKKLKEGYMIVTDRYFWSSVAYGSLDRGIDFRKGEQNGQVLLTAYGILSAYYQFIVPNVTFFLKISPQTALKRLSKKKEAKDIYDKKEKLEIVAAGYDWLMKKFPDKFVIIDGEKTIEQITEDILKKITAV